MEALTHNFPKALLHVANRPLLSYQLDMLHSAGIDDITILTKPKMREEVEKFVDKYKGEVNRAVRVVAAPDDAMGSADSLRACREELNITKDFFVVSSDVITTIPLQSMANAHRHRQATMTMMMQVPPEAVAAAAAAAKGEGEAPAADAAASSGSGSGAADEFDDIDTQFVALDEATGRLAYVRARSDLETGIKLPKRVLASFPSLGIYSQLRDAHLHLFSPAVFEFLEEQSHISSLQGELAPALVAAQFVPSAQDWLRKSTSHTGQRTDAPGFVDPRDDAPLCVGGPASPLPTDGLGIIGAGADDDDDDDARLAAGAGPEAVEARDWVGAQSHSRPAADASLGPLRCYAFVAPGTTLLARCNTVASLHSLSLQLVARARDGMADPWTAVTEGDFAAAAKAATPTAGLTNCLVGTGVQLAPSTLRNSFIGAHCRIGKGCRIDNCVIMDHVSVGDKVILSNCVIAPQAKIHDGASLKQCTVALKYEVVAAKYESMELRPDEEGAGSGSASDEEDD